MPLDRFGNPIRSVTDTEDWHADAAAWQAEEERRQSGTPTPQADDPDWTRFFLLLAPVALLVLWLVWRFILTPLGVAFS
jgi:hypothetical protein